MGPTQQLENHGRTDGSEQAGSQPSSQTGAQQVSPAVVRVELYGVVRDLVRDTNLEVRLPDREGTSFEDVLEELAERYGPAFRDRLFDSRGLLSHVKVYCGGKPVDDLSRPLPAGEEKAVRIIVFAAAGGG